MIDIGDINLRMKEALDEESENYYQCCYSYDLLNSSCYEDKWSFNKHEIDNAVCGKTDEYFKPVRIIVIQMNEI